MSRRPLLMWGATGQALVLQEFAASVGFELVALLDRDAAVRPPITNVPIFIGSDALEQWSQTRSPNPIWFVIAIGGEHGRTRLALAGHLKAHGLLPATLIHPTAFVAASATLGAGSVILAGAAIGVGVHVGECGIINTRASIDHECRLGAGVHIGPGATLAGCVVVGECVFIASGAVVVPRRHIGDDSIIGAGSVVVRDIPAEVVAFGNPARVVRMRNADRRA